MDKKFFTIMGIKYRHGKQADFMTRSEIQLKEQYSMHLTEVYSAAY